MLAFWLNLALLPCALAIQEPDDLHDCCPPTIELQQLNCCEVDPIAIDHRYENSADEVVATVTEYQAVRPSRRTPYRLAVPPPDPDVASQPIYVINCVYLK
jgi:hypothetical protein